MKTALYRKASRKKKSSAGDPFCAVLTTDQQLAEESTEAERAKGNQSWIERHGKEFHVMVKPE